MMSSPTPLSKPWEYSTFGIGSSGIGAATGGPPTHYVPNTGSIQPPGRLQSSYPSPYPQSSGGGGSTSTMQNTTATVPPPLPPRPSSTTATGTRPIYSVNRPAIGAYPYGQNYGYGYSTPTLMNTMGAYNTSYGGAYGGYNSGYNYMNRPSYGYGYGQGATGAGAYGGYGYGPENHQPTFSQLAEESSAPAFQSIESFVGAFGSISAMLESTFHAVYSSFRAVVGVADHLGRVREILKTFAIFRFLRWVWRRVMYLIGISKIKPEQIENLWNSISQEQQSEEHQQGAFGFGAAEELFAPRSKPSSWPIIMFLGFIFAGPYLMWKLIRKLNMSDGKIDGRDTSWSTGQSDHFLATPEYDFDPTSPQELRLRKGQTIRLAPAAQQPSNVHGWILASDGIKIGLVPVTYIKVLGKRSGNPVPIKVHNFNDTNTPANNYNYNSSPIPSVVPLGENSDIPSSRSISRSSSQSTLKAGEN